MQQSQVYINAQFSKLLKEGEPANMSLVERNEDAAPILVLRSNGVVMELKGDKVARDMHNYAKTYLDRLGSLKAVRRPRPEIRGMQFFGLFEASMHDLRSSVIMLTAEMDLAPLDAAIKEYKETCTHLRLLTMPGEAVDDDEQPEDPINHSSYLLEWTAKCVVAAVNLEREYGKCQRLCTPCALEANTISQLALVAIDWPHLYLPAFVLDKNYEQGQHQRVVNAYPELVKHFEHQVDNYVSCYNQLTQGPQCWAFALGGMQYFYHTIQVVGRALLQLHLVSSCKYKIDEAHDSIEALTRHFRNLFVLSGHDPVTIETQLPETIALSVYHEVASLPVEAHTCIIETMLGLRVLNPTGADIIRGVITAEGAFLSTKPAPVQPMYDSDEDLFALPDPFEEPEQPETTSSPVNRHLFLNTKPGPAPVSFSSDEEDDLPLPSFPKTAPQIQHPQPQALQVQQPVFQPHQFTYQRWSTRPRRGPDRFVDRVFKGTRDYSQRKPKRL